MPTEMTVRAAIEARRSIRRYTGEAISNEIIEEILRLANLAPTPWNLQPTRVVVVTRQEDKDALMAASYGQPQVGAAAAAFVIYSDMRDVIETAEETVHPGMRGEKGDAQVEQIRGIFGGMGDDAADSWGLNHAYTFMGFFLLAAQSMGYSTSAMLGFEADKVRALYDLPEHAKIAAVVAMGVAAEEGFEHHRHDVNRFVRFV